ncbi:MAG: histidine kinase dimerization/phospho-acceptor domain-containing protein [Lachnospiraceae bacterium]|nr:histidine kinase dimerization/phospho-acceptor domain-containing protein [Lachnospiraceae bacterium]
MCESEMNQLRQHTEEGYKLACLSERLHPYADIIRGHHRSYDGKSGYPEAFDNTASPDHFFIDLIRICDCLDAGTDAIGHVYCKTKDFDEVLEELTEGAGTQYHPELVQLILENEPLREAMKYQCGAGRLRTYYETYQTYMQDVPERPEHSELPESIADAMEREVQAEKIKVLQSLEKTAMLILYVDLLKDEYQVVYCGERTKTECFSKVTDGSFSSFLMSDLRKIVNPSDWVQLEQLTGVQSLSNRIYEADGLLEKTVRIRESAQERWVRVQFLEAEESQTVLHKITVCIQDVDQQERQREQLLDAVKLASAQAREASQAKSRFLSSMSHDIRTPLNAIVGMTQIARMHLPEQGKVEECLE